MSNNWFPNIGVGSVKVISNCSSFRVPDLDYFNPNTVRDYIGCINIKLIAIARQNREPHNEVEKFLSCPALNLKWIHFSLEMSVGHNDQV